MGIPRFRPGNWFSRPSQLPPASENANTAKKALENQFPGLNQGIPMFILLKTLSFSRKRSQNVLPNHGHQPSWLHPYYMACQMSQICSKKPMFSGILSFFLKKCEFWRPGWPLWLSRGRLATPSARFYLRPTPRAHDNALCVQNLPAISPFR